MRYRRQRTIKELVVTAYNITTMTEAAPAIKRIVCQTKARSPIRVFNPAGTKRCVLLKDNHIRRVKPTHRYNDSTKLLGPLKTVRADSPPQTATEQQSAQAGTVDLKPSHVRHQSAIEARPAHKSIHDTMLDQELQTFREEVEWKYRNSTINKSYKFPCTSSTQDSLTPSDAAALSIDSGPNCTSGYVLAMVVTVLPANTFDSLEEPQPAFVQTETEDHEKSPTNGPIHKFHITRTVSSCAPVAPAGGKRLEFYHRVKEILTAGVLSGPHCTVAKSTRNNEVKTCSGESDSQSGRYQTQRLPSQKNASPSNAETSAYNHKARYYRKVEGPRPAAKIVCLKRTLSKNASAGMLPSSRVHIRTRTLEGSESQKELKRPTRVVRMLKGKLGGAHNRIVQNSATPLRMPSQMFATEGAAAKRELSPRGPEGAFLRTMTTGNSGPTAKDGNGKVHRGIRIVDKWRRQMNV